MRFFEPEAAFYLFCAVDGFADSRALALRLIDEAGVGVAPGGAFGPGGEGHLRLCFARDPDQIAEATRRMARWLAGVAERGRAASPSGPMLLVRRGLWRRSKLAIKLQTEG